MDQNGKGHREELGGTEEEETRTRIYYMKKIVFNKRKKICYLIFSKYIKATSL